MTDGGKEEKESWGVVDRWETLKSHASERALADGVTTKAIHDILKAWSNHKQAMYITGYHLGMMFALEYPELARDLIEYMRKLDGHTEERIGASKELTKQMADGPQDSDD